MKKVSFIAFVLLAFLPVHNLYAQTKSSVALFKHTVIITFKEDAPADSIQALDQLYTDLSQNPVVKDFEWGINTSPRDTTEVKHIYVTTFATQQDLSSYKKNPQYARLFPLSLAIADDVSVVDYWVEK